MEADLAEVRVVTQTLLARRAAEGSVCPSEVGRALAGAANAPRYRDWRDAMPAVHAAVDLLVAEGSIRLSWKGKPLPVRGGPYRILRPE